MQHTKRAFNFVAFLRCRISVFCYLKLYELLDAAKCSLVRVSPASGERGHVPCGHGCSFGTVNCGSCGTRSLLKSPEQCKKNHRMLSVPRSECWFKHVICAGYGAFASWFHSSRAYTTPRAVRQQATLVVAAIVAMMTLDAVTNAAWNSSNDGVRRS